MSPPAAAEPERSLDLLRQMILIRRFEEKAAEVYTVGKIRGFLHLYVGEEAVAVGTAAVLQPGDAIVATYREHGHAIARGIDPKAVMAEMFGKATGCCRGHGGSMHLFDAARRFYGGNAIVGGGLPLAVGLALADRVQGVARVTACYFGEGAAAEGAFHESLNLAALWRLPVLFLCENNLYAMGTAIWRSQSRIEVAEKALAYGIPGRVVDGMDVFAVEAATREAARQVRNGSGPQFLELRTYRFRAHSMYDPELYRSKAEVEEWKKRDPIGLLVSRLRAAGALPDSALERIEREVTAAIDEAVRFADESPVEPESDLLRDVHTPTGAP